MAELVAELCVMEEEIEGTWTQNKSYGRLKKKIDTKSRKTIRDGRIKYSYIDEG
jgi:hypothetical protein